VKDVSWYQNKVTVKGLEMSSQYAYRVGYDTVWSGINTFKTHNPASFNFIAVGDPQLGASISGAHAIPEQKANIEAYDSIGWQKTVTTITQQVPEASFIVSMGDQIESYLSLSVNDREYTSFFAPLELLGIPIATVCGNHDFALGSYFGYHYNLPNQSHYGEANGNDGDYWFAYGDALFMVLNSNVPNIATHEAFIDQTIRANPFAKWRIVCLHHGLFTAAEHCYDNDVNFRRATYTAVFDKYGIDIVFGGHDHQFSRSKQIFNGQPVPDLKQRVAQDSSITVFDPKGTVYMDLNSGTGSKFYDRNAKFTDTTTNVVTMPAWNAKFWQNYEASFSSVSVDMFHLSIVTYSVNDTRHPIDSYTIVKFRGPSPIRGDVKFCPF
jgi:UDP-2,3-diacylglucosamine pyrophosphatase LpxH